tara:strand:- start:32 stop:511 length:480 start_codon:yes stop_codon:yes gene_type:complete
MGVKSMRSDYLQLLRKQVGKYAGTLRDVVILAPVYGMLMFTLMKDPRLSREQRLLVDAAIAYLVSPDDVIPEDEVGSYGYLDDVFCCAYVAQQLGEELGWEVVQEHWTGEQSVLEVSRGLLARERELLGDSGDDILRFAGLLDTHREWDGKPELILERV